MGSRSLLAGALAVLTLAAGAAPAAADVAYIDGNEVWLSTLDGSQKLRLSGGENDWRDVAISDQGYVVGVRLEAGKIADLSTFTVWNPQGQQIKFGPLAGRPNMVLAAFPLNLQLSPDAGTLVYGYSGQFGFGQFASFTRGTNFLPSDTVVTPVAGTFNVTDLRAPALVGTRVVGSVGYRKIGVQSPQAIDEFDLWPGIDFAPLGEVLGLDLPSAADKLVAEVYLDGAGTPDERSRLVVYPRLPGLGAAPVPIAGGDVGDCFMPAAPGATHPQFSADGSVLLWSDAAGVHAAPAPLAVTTDGVQNLCTLPGPVATLSATGRNPAIGPVSVAAINAARSGGAPAPAPGTAPGPGGSAPAQGAGGAPAGPTLGKLSALKLAALASRRGASVRVTSPQGGKTTLRLTVKPSAVGRKGKTPITVATGKGSLKAATAGKVALKFTATGRTLRRKLRGKRATLKVSAAGRTTTASIKLS